MKSFLKKIPLIGWFLRFIYNLLRINNLKFVVFSQKEELGNQKEELGNQKEELGNQKTSIQNLETELQQIKGEFSNFNQNIDSIIAKEMFYNMLSVQQRIDQFLFDSKMTLSNNDININEKLQGIDHKSKLFLDDYYLAFENKFRGSREDILKRCENYLQYINISNISKSLDIACGRGEFVQILQNHDVEAYGIDLNYAMVEEAKKYKVKNVIREDVFHFLSTIEDNTYDLITGFHIAEHITFEKLMILFAEVKRVLKTNGKMIFETPNPKNLLVASLTFYNDPTHLNPLPPDVLKFMIEYIGFNEVDIVELHPFNTAMHIQENTVSSNMLNNLLFSEQDYMVIGTK